MIRFDQMPLAVQEAMCTPMHIIIPSSSTSSSSSARTPRTGSLYLGSLAAVHEHEALRANGITHLVQVLDGPWHAFADVSQSAYHQAEAKSQSRPGHSGFHSYKIDIMDQSSADLRPHLEAVCEHIDRCLLQGASVLVHCQQGISRSASIVIAYLIRNKGMSYDNAFALVRKQRACVKPNPGFVRALREWEEMWHNQGQRPGMARRFTT